MGTNETLSGFGRGRKPAHLRDFAALSPGQHCPTHCPPLARPAGPPESPLGRPLSIVEVAQLIGCSPWTVRQRHIPHGLPYFRSGPAAS